MELGTHIYVSHDYVIDTIEGNIEVHHGIYKITRLVKTVFLDGSFYLDAVYNPADGYGETKRGISQAHNIIADELNVPIEIVERFRIA